MVSPVGARATACAEVDFTVRGITPARNIVICDPAVLYAEVIEAVVLQQTRWQVACVTTDIDAAVVAAQASGAHALLFDVIDGTSVLIAEVIQHVRRACPGLALLLLAGLRNAARGESFCSSTVNNALAWDLARGTRRGRFTAIAPIPTGSYYNARQ
jgi:hypothetical protein